MDVLEEFCEETGLTKIVAVERAIMKYVEQYNKEQEQLKSLKQNKEQYMITNQRKNI